MLRFNAGLISELGFTSSGTKSELILVCVDLVQYIVILVLERGMRWEQKFKKHYYLLQDLFLFDATFKGIKGSNYWLSKGIMARSNSRSLNCIVLASF